MRQSAYLGTPPPEPRPSNCRIPPGTYTVVADGNHLIINLQGAQTPSLAAALSRATKSEPTCENRENVAGQSLLAKAESFVREYPLLTFTVCFAGLHMLEKIIESLAKGSSGMPQLLALTGASFFSALKFFINKQPTSRK
jgi:hypothetical protein